TGTLTFTPGTSTQTISVPVIGDTLDEPNETFAVNLTHADNAVLDDPQGVGTILDNDPPAISINNVAVTEGNSGTVSATFTLRLSSASGQTVSVHYATADGTAVAGRDYLASTGTLTFPPGTTTQTLVVPI